MDFLISNEKLEQETEANKRKPLPLKERTTKRKKGKSTFMFI
jgi:hypothetical protein